MSLVAVVRGALKTCLRFLKTHMYARQETCILHSKSSDIYLLCCTNRFRRETDEIIDLQVGAASPTRSRSSARITRTARPYIIHYKAMMGCCAQRTGRDTVIDRWRSCTFPACRSLTNSRWTLAVDGPGKKSHSTPTRTYLSKRPTPSSPRRQDRSRPLSSRKTLSPSSRHNKLSTILLSDDSIRPLIPTLPKDIR